MNRQRTELRYVFLLLLTSFIWGSTFVAQSVGAELVGPLSFTGVRNWIGAAALLPLALFRRRRAVQKASAAKDGPAPWRYVLLGGLVCGFFLFLGASLQQAGIATTSAAKAGFITTLYVVFVPIFSIARGMVPAKKIWLCVFLALVGLFLLSVTSAFTIARGDALMLLCAVGFSFQIMAVDHFVKTIDPILLACVEFTVNAILCTVLGVILEGVDTAGILAAMPYILFSAIFSSAIAYTLQIVSQSHLSPSVAALVMSMESVFAALSGWVILHQRLSARELIGCVLMFAAIVLSQIELPKKRTLVP